MGNIGAMNALQRYINANPGALARLAGAAGVTLSQMSRIAHGKRGASLPVAQAIEDETGGSVTVAEISALAVGARKARRPSQTEAA